MKIYLHRVVNEDAYELTLADNGRYTVRRISHLSLVSVDGVAGAEIIIRELVEGLKILGDNEHPLYPDSLQKEID